MFNKLLNLSQINKVLHNMQFSSSWKKLKQPPTHSIYIFLSWNKLYFTVQFKESVLQLIWI